MSIGKGAKEENIVGFSAMIGRHFEKYLCSHKGKIPSGVYSRIIEEVEKQLIIVTLFYTKHNQVQTAEILGINRNTLHRKIVKYKLDEKVL